MARSKCSPVEVFYQLLLSGYKYLFEQWEQHTRYPHAQITSKPKWQWDWETGQIQMWKVWFVFYMQRAHGINRGKLFIERNQERCEMMWSCSMTM
jgi:hypothetical protein